MRPVANVLMRLVVLGALAAMGFWWWSHGPGGADQTLPALSVEITALDLVEAFDRGDATLKVVRESADMPLRAMAFATLDKSTQLASDQDAKVIHARAESAFELTVGPLPAGARLVAQTYLHTANRKQPEPLPRVSVYLEDRNLAARRNAFEMKSRNDPVIGKSEREPGVFIQREHHNTPTASLFQ